MLSVRDFNYTMGMLYSLKENLIVLFLLYCNSKAQKNALIYILYVRSKNIVSFWLC